MFVDSLLILSAKIVAKCLEEGRYKHLDFTLTAPLSDQVFLELANSPSIWSSVIAKETGLKLNLSNLNVKSIPHEDYENLHLHNIRSMTLDLKVFWHVPKYRIRARRGVDIVGILRTCLNEESRQNLKKLRFTGYIVFFDDWIENLAQLLPNLISLECRIDEEGFERACTSFPNLLSLKTVFINDLRGIRHMRNLQMLNLNATDSHSPEEIRELFDLPNLRVLDVSESDLFFVNLLLCEGTFQNLRFIDCYDSDITEEQVRELVERYPSLEVIFLLETDCDETDFSDLPITVLNLATIKSTMNTLRYLIDKRTFTGDTEKCVKLIARMMYSGEGVIDEEDHGSFLMSMMKLKKNWPPCKEELINSCIFLFYETSFPGHTITDILNHLNSIAHTNPPFLAEQRWAAQSHINYCRVLINQHRGRQIRRVQYRR
uniref:F-box domain-containing protein n=1 Tax=Caenorhabditis tropicalis TaxID=1561998 RepID=A0A1I7TVM1_9PELO